MTLELTPYVPSQHGLDALLHVWHQAAAVGEHHRVFGEVARSPTQFVGHYLQTAEILFVYEQGAAWTTGQVLGMAWLDDICAGNVSARLHYWLAPQARTQKLAGALATLVLHHLFEIRGFLVLTGRTPATMDLALRFARQIGFKYAWTCPNGMKDGEQITDAVYSVMTREAWQARQEG